MSREHTPSIDLALSLATPLPLPLEVDFEGAVGPSALPDPTSSERQEFRDEHLGPVTQLSQRFPLGKGVWLLVHWLVDPRAPDTAPKHVRHVELVTNGDRLPLRRGQIDVLMSAIGLAEYVFETAEREELARRTC